MTLGKRTAISTARPHADLSRRVHAPFSRTERTAVTIVIAALVGFCIFGFATGAPSTVGYEVSVLVIGVAILWLRRAVVPDLLALALALAAILDLAGGLINVGQDVLYNASVGPFSKTLGTHYLQYDHFAHAYATFVITYACWVMLAAPYAAAQRRRDLVILAVGTAVGLGALNEVVEFIATLAHHGAHVGGYFNTGWDLICNLIGACAAGVVIVTCPPASAQPDSPGAPP
jgi:hypothetical protein